MLIAGHANSPAFKKIIKSLTCLRLGGDADSFLLSSGGIKHIKPQQRLLDVFCKVRIKQENEDRTYRT